MKMKQHGSPKHGMNGNKIITMSTDTSKEKERKERKDFFLLVAAWVRSRAERPSVSYTKVSAVSILPTHAIIQTETNSNKTAAATNSKLRGTGR